MALREIEWKGVDWLHLAEDRYQWQAVWNTVMNVGFHERQRISVS
jgi:hypothetical protein